MRDEHCCRLLQHSSYGTRASTQNWEEELASTLSNLNLTRGIRRTCVRKGCIKNEDVVATVHRDAITIGGERLAVVECLVKMIARKYEIKKQVAGGDADLSREEDES